ncbi:hypothetical protein CVU37_11465 [candidate division BRC1 bacterium HGW-BRC1-1]|jgi:prepilin-type N-terminal cleavage/methylation domain-containing protein|nr:MAG: hypothetical protein CVU37_11465 [candidate division BRC1 bacterium HGW-BRC1-1]
MIETLRNSSARRAFTLIELLIVVAIIAILAAIAVPNFLEAQVRSKVSRVKADLRSMATAIESYVVDNNKYPPENWASPHLITVLGGQHIPNIMRLTRLTTPVAYVTAIPADVFAPNDDPINLMLPHTFHYVSINDPLHPGDQVFFLGQNDEKRQMMWMLQSCGPDRGSDGPASSTYWQFPQYDSTNGSVSIGNILRSGP